VFKSLFDIKNDLNVTQLDLGCFRSQCDNNSYRKQIGYRNGVNQTNPLKNSIIE